MIGFTLPTGTEKLVVKTEKYNAAMNPFLVDSFPPLEGLPENEIPDSYFDGDIQAYIETKRLILENELSHLLATLRQLDSVDEILEEIDNYRESLNVSTPSVPDDFDKAPF
jgi:hypothetical protein